VPPDPIGLLQVAAGMWTGRETIGQLMVRAKADWLTCAFMALALSACSTSDITDSVQVDAAQGSQSNIASLTAVVEKNPKSAEAYNVRGSAYGLAKQYREAIDDFTTAIQLNPRFYKAYANRALVYRAINEQEAAVKDYSQAIKINPQYDEAYIGRGNVYRLAGQDEQAFRDYQRAIQIGTTNPRAYHARGLIYQKRGENNQAARRCRALQQPRRFLPGGGRSGKRARGHQPGAAAQRQIRRGLGQPGAGL
jgi:tetratricopeptide (TPR) repeat protein